MAEPRLRQPLHLPPGRLRGGAGGGRRRRRRGRRAGRGRRERRGRTPRHRLGRGRRDAARPGGLREPLRRLPAGHGGRGVPERDLVPRRRVPLRRLRRGERPRDGDRRLQPDPRRPQRPELQPRALQGRLGLLPRQPLPGGDSPLRHAGSVVRRRAGADRLRRLRAPSGGHPVPGHRLRLRRLERERAAGYRRRPAERHPTSPGCDPRPAGSVVDPRGVLRPGPGLLRRGQVPPSHRGLAAGPLQVAQSQAGPGDHQPDPPRLPEPQRVRSHARDRARPGAVRRGLRLVERQHREPRRAA